MKTTFGNDVDNGNHVDSANTPPSVWGDVNAEEIEFFETSDSLKDNSSPERLALTEEIKKVIFDTIEQLPEELKVAIQLREIDGMSYEEISTAMGCPIGTVRSRIFRARDAIDTNLQPLLENK